jgi:hypothetical protein
MTGRGDGQGIYDILLEQQSLGNNCMDVLKQKGTFAKTHGFGLS